MSKNCNTELFCRNCRPRLRRLEFEVNELKLTNEFLKEHLQACELQCKDADQNPSGALSSRRRPSMNSSPAGFSNALESTSNVCESLSPASKALLDLQKKLIGWTEQYRLLAHKYNEMVRRLQDCQDALHCSSKQTYELEKVNLELQIQLKEILQVEHSSNEDLLVQKQGVNQAFASHSMGAMLQKNPKLEKSAQIYLLNALMPDSLHYEAVPAATCARSLTCDYQRNMMPIASTEALNAIVLPSSTCINPPGFTRSQETPLMSIPCVNIKAQIGEMATPSSQPVHTDGTCLPHFGISASESGWNPVLSTFSPTNAVIMERSTPKKQHSSRQINTSLSEVVSPSDHRGLKNKHLKDTKKTLSHITKADHSLGPASPNVSVTSPTVCKQSHDEDGSTVINVPKIISIRASSHGRQPNGSNDQRIPKGAASDAAPVLSPIVLHKPRRHRRHSAPISNEVEKEMKVVALAENMECVAFPQGTYKTEMCNKWVKSMGQYCPYEDKCQFAHGPHELRPVLRHRRYKSILCRMVAAGDVCPYEHRCHFRHVIYPHEAELLS